MISSTLEEESKVVPRDKGSLRDPVENNEDPPVLGVVEKEYGEDIELKVE